MVKIALMSADYPNIISGVGDYSARLLQEWRQAGHQVILITARHPAVARPEGAVLALRWKMRSFFQLQAFLNRHQPEVISLQYPCSLYGKSSLTPHFFLAALRLRGWKIVTTLHEFSNVHPLRRWSEYLLVWCSRRVIVTNEFERTALLRVVPFTPAEKVQVIPIGSNLPPVPPAPLPAERTAISFFGIFYPNKQMERVIEVMAAIEQEFPGKFTFRFVGGIHPYYPEYLAQFRGLAERVLPRTEWHINQPLEKVAALLNGSFCGVLFYKDGVSIRRGSFLAFLTCGIPVITSPGPYSADLRPLDGKGVFYFTPDLKNVADIIRSLQHPPFYESCSAHLSAFAGRFQFPRIAKRYVEAFLAVL